MYEGATFQGFRSVELSHNNVMVPWPDLKATLQDHLRLPVMNELKQPWALFSPTGERLAGEQDGDDENIKEPFTRPLHSLGMFLLLEGGQWVWPGVRKGFVRHVRLDETRNATIETLSTHPLVFSVDGFLSHEECDWIRERAKPQMRQSGVSLMDHDKGRPATDFRTSETTFLTTKTPEIEEIDRRTSLLVRIPGSHQEPPQVLRYGLNAKYNQHTDYFDKRLYANDQRTLKMIANGRKNRMATVLWYLSDVAGGGETSFPRMDGGPAPTHDTQCRHGLQVRPVKGRVIIFYSLKPDGALDPWSVHAACPVLDGEKWAANKWVWNEPWSM
jgi:prolyl 4-hydroxylase